ncbi:lytic transglycosylase domain-containing protein, partial [Sphingobium sp. AN641]|uniref:lytic transglycosylase domain-containing protein n=1 Tax=Sphingobium sp. AN641 TaxID=3133443 RepID=UPI0030C19C78
MLLACRFCITADNRTHDRGSLMPLSTTVLAALLTSCAPNVAPATMAAIIQVESENDPFRIGINSGGSLVRQPGNAADAVATARSLLRKGANFDAGLMQINSANFARLGVTPETVFDPCTNLRAGARLLADNYGRARVSGHADPLRAALSEYNTGSRSRGLVNGYVGKVFAAANGSAVVRPLVARSSRAIVTADQVAGILVSAFGGRITDTLRPMNARYGAQNSFHKYGQAVDFVPNGGMSAINRAQIRAVLAANGVQIIELLGP